MTGAKDSEGGIVKNARNILLTMTAIAIVVALGHAAPMLMPGDYDTVTNEELAKLLSSGESVAVVDVRRADDFRAGHIEGAINIPHGEFRQRYDEVPRDGIVAVTCYAGILNRVDSRRLARAGYDVVCIEGGMKGWNGELKRQ